MKITVAAIQMESLNGDYEGKSLFCKIYDERFTKQDDIVTFRAGLNESNEIQ